MNIPAETVSSLGLIQPAGVVRPTHWRLALVLGIAAGIASVLLLPYALTLLPEVAEKIRVPLALFAAAQALQATILVTLLAWAGLRLGFAYALDAPRLRRWLGGSALVPPARWRSAALLGVGVGVAVVFIGMMLPTLAQLRGAVVPSWWQGLLASFYGGIVEETLCRLLLVSLIVWIGAHVTRSPPSPGIYVTGIVIAALLFGAAHVPTLTQMHAFTPGAALTVIGLNAICGCAYGWLFWRHGLEHAMLAHFCTDIVLHALAPLLASH